MFLPAREGGGDIVDAVADRVRREAPSLSNIAATETGAAGVHPYGSARMFPRSPVISSIRR